MLSIRCTIALNHEEIGEYSQRISKIKSFINKYNWKRKKGAIRKDDLKKLEKNNPKIALNMLYVKKLHICPACTSNFNLTLRY